MEKIESGDIATIFVGVCNECLFSVETCHECYDDLTVCKVCAPEFILKNGECVEKLLEFNECGDSFLKHSTDVHNPIITETKNQESCFPCTDAQCETCTPAVEQCIVCLENTADQHFLKAQACTKDCGEGEVGILNELGNFVCTSCNEADCVKCPETPAICEQCKNAYKTQDGKCVPECADGYREVPALGSTNGDFFGQCVECSIDNCAECSESECFRCTLPFYLLNNESCPDACPTEEYAHQNLKDQNVCTACEDGCRFCTVDVDECSECYNNSKDVEFYLEAQHCHKNCDEFPSTFEFVENGAGECNDCGNHCDVCKSSEICIICEKDG